ncbi:MULTISPECIES: HAD family hydrolase [Streptomyces]|uniref:HAD family hydrolase n=1 Tax=Streptomyces TaxID=1883 RepID=UPI00287F6F2B|nr:HAD hydrolase-like protein [Streptomyces sp. CGMCC 4.1456]WNF67167.1 HAD hydrolase-like protein [Streptomyces sp. CGMCC 4.1456]
MSLDVGYTLGEPSGTTLTQRLAGLSPLPAAQAKQIAQRSLHPLDPRSALMAVESVCAELGIRADAFPHDHRPPSFTLWPGALEAVARIAQIVPVVTLSNVTYWDELASDITGLLAPHLMAHYPSWRLGCAKPDPRAVQTVARLHDVHPSQLLHVGDSLDYDVRGALAAGARALWMTPQTPPPEARRLLAQYAGRFTIVPDLATAVTHIEQATTTPEATSRSTPA